MHKETPEVLDEAKRVLRYDPATGLMWRGSAPAFTAINYSRPRGYRVGRVQNVQLYAHRVAWALHTGAWPVGFIDHINGDSLDNRWANLRVVTSEENQKNRGLNRNNKSGVSGVIYIARARTWQVQIKHRGKMIHLGWHRCFFKAVKARKAAEAEYGFHENHGMKRRTA